MNNNLTGEIPERFSEIKYMSSMDFGNNNLSGSISAIENFKYLILLRLANNNFSGSIPAGIWNNTDLLQAFFNNNQLDFIETVNSPSSKTEVKLNNNKIGFASIVPNMSELNTYNNQVIDGRDTLIGVETRDIALTISDNHPDNNYQWYKDGDTILGATDRRYVINGISFANAGKYHASITNSNFDPAKYTFWRDTIYLNVITLRDADSLALVDLYNSTNGSEWEKKGNWLEANKSMDDWYGITIADGRVQEIKLDDNKLVGSISSSIGALDRLRKLNLSKNDLSGNIFSIASLISLEELVLSENNLTGTIPSELGSLENLTELLLHTNNLTGSIPLELGSLMKLTELLLHTNNLTGSIPFELGSLENLTELLLHTNNLMGSIPSELSNLENLTELLLHTNNLTGSIPSELGGLENLAQLRLNNNNLTGPIPSELGGLANIQNLDLKNNELNSIENISSIPTDAIIDIRNNKIGFVSVALYIGVIDLYDNQVLDTKDTIYADVDDKFSLTVSDDHPDNSYQWYKDGDSIQDATNRIYSVEGFGVDDAGEYYATIKNTINPGVTFRREKIHVFINRILDFDSLALVSFYKSTNGDEWSNNDNWLSASPIDSWHGVTIENNRVDILDLSDNNLTGTIPFSINQLSALQSLDVSDNSISSIDDISSVPVSADVLISNNRIGFASIVPNILVIDSYEGQVIDNIDTSRIIVGGSLSINISDDHESNSYQWYKDGNSIVDATDRVYTIGNVSLG